MPIQNPDIDQFEVAHRQGGDANNWATAGTTDYASPGGIIQAGSKEWTGSASATGSLTVTFPAAFAYSPIVMVTAWLASSQTIVGNLSSVSASSFSIEWEDWEGNVHTSVVFHWVAVGPSA